MCYINITIYCKRRNFRAFRAWSHMRENYDVSENLNHYSLDGIRYKISENMSTRKAHIGLDARKFSCAKISTFTVHNYSAIWCTNLPEDRIVNLMVVITWPASFCARHW